MVCVCGSGICGELFREEKLRVACELRCGNCRHLRTRCLSPGGLHAGFLVTQEEWSTMRASFDRINQLINYDDGSHKNKKDHNLKPQQVFLRFGGRHLGRGSWEKTSGRGHLGRQLGEGICEGTSEEGHLRRGSWEDSSKTWDPCDLEPRGII